ncbi:uncharacterized protein [Henckelia pumila]|uniref:uncharacterized protein n=1 Tax=Henckelia pumila TaxID=405737 RepID=UPI003C6DF11C
MARLYVQEVVRLHGISLSIVSDRDPSYHRSIDMAPFKALYRRRCRTPLFWDEVGERQVEGPQMIQQMTDAVEMIREHVFLRVSPFRKVMRFGLKGKLSPRFIGPLEILDKVGDVAYRLALPSYFSSIHDEFHVSLLRQYVADESHILHPIEVKLDQDLSYVERPLRIFDRKDKVLRNKSIPLMKVQWQRRGTEEATWELESRMRAEHP